MGRDWKETPPLHMSGCNADAFQHSSGMCCGKNSRSKNPGIVYREKHNRIFFLSSEG